MTGTRARKNGALLIIATLAVLTAAAFRTGVMPRSLPIFGMGPSLTKGRIGHVLESTTSLYRFPTEVDLAQDSQDPAHRPERAIIEYAFDATLQDQMEQEFHRYGPDYGAFVALDAKTGRILSMVSYTKDPAIRENLALRSTFPSASVFKVVTAAAAIEERKFNANTVIPFAGANHTLYRHNVFKTATNRWTRYSTLKEAFAKSINTVFGKIGAYNLDPQQLRLYADRFGFNRKIAADVPVQPGHAPIPEDPWGIAEAASGYTRENTMSPLQGALIAAAVVNDGVMMEPYLVQSVYRADGSPMYAAQPTIANEAVDRATSQEIRKLMRETVTNGTCRKSFHGFFRHSCALLDVGGKTGTLSGLNPAGHYDWFVGFADDGSQKIAVASLTIHKQYWKVKSSVLARTAIENYFKNKDAHHPHSAESTARESAQGADKS